MTTEHIDLDDLKARFEDGDRPTGEDFARLIDSCHNTRHLTDTTITSTLSVQGAVTTDSTINGRNISADGAKLDSVYNDVNTLRSTWEESDEIQGVSDRVTLIENVSSTWNTTTSVVVANSAEWANHTNVDIIMTELSDVRTTVDTNSAEWANHTNVDIILTELSDVRSTVDTNSADWIIDTNTDTNKLSELLDVDVTSIENNDVLKYNSTDSTWYAARDLHGEGQHVDRFVELHDTPVSYDSGNPGEYVTIKPSGDGLMFSSLLNNLEFNSLKDDFTDIETVVDLNGGNWSLAFGWGDHAQAGYLTDYTVTQDDVTAHQSVLSITESQISDLGMYLTDYTVTQDDVTAHQGALSITESQISDLGMYLTDYTVTQDDVTAHQGALSITESQISDLGAYLTQVDLDGIQSHITEVHNVSGNWALLDSNGVLMEDQIPELSITQTYTVQNPEEVATLNPAEGIQRGDIVIVTSTYDNLIAKTDSPTGTYNSSTKAYSGYSKLARPDAYVTSVNDMYGNVTISSDNIDDTDNTNKWVTQDDIDNWNDADNKFVNSTGDTMTGDLDTTANILSGGKDLLNVFWVKGESLAAIGNYDIQGEMTADGYATKNTAGDTVVGITKNVNIGGNILHIVNGIIVGVTDA